MVGKGIWNWLETIRHLYDIWIVLLRSSSRGQWRMAQWTNGGWWFGWCEEREKKGAIDAARPDLGVGWCTPVTWQSVVTIVTVTHSELVCLCVLVSGEWARVKSQSKSGTEWLVLHCICLHDLTAILVHLYCQCGSSNWMQWVGASLDYDEGEGKRGKGRRKRGRSLVDGCSWLELLQLGVIKSVEWRKVVAIFLPGTPVIPGYNENTLTQHSIKVPACERRISLLSPFSIEGAMGQFAKCKRKGEDKSISCTLTQLDFGLFHLLTCLFCTRSMHQIKAKANVHVSLVYWRDCFSFHPQVPITSCPSHKFFPVRCPHCTSL